MKKWSPVKSIKPIKGVIPVKPIKTKTPVNPVKVGKVMWEFKKWTLNIWKSPKIVKSPKQAIAIALSVAKIKSKKTKK